MDTTFVYGRTLLNFLATQNITIAISSYKSHSVLSIGVKNDDEPDLAIYICPITRCMGMDRYKDRLVLSNIGSIIMYNSKGASKHVRYGYFTDEYQARFQYHSADVDVHDLKITETGIYYASASYNCIAMPSLDKTFEPYWIPPWITPATDPNDPSKKYLRREDCCHLNGLCCVDGKPKYVTCTSMGNTLGHWRKNKDEGVVYDIQLEEIVCRDIHSPHSPNWYRNKLWVLESGTGYFGYVDLKTKSFVKQIFLPGFLRGMTFHDKFAIVCLSKDRHDHAFKDLPLRENLMCNRMDASCGFRIIDMDIMSVVEEFTFGDVSGITELYDVICLPGHRSRILSIQEIDSVNHYDKLTFNVKSSTVSDIFDVSGRKEPLTNSLSGNNELSRKKEVHSSKLEEEYHLPMPTLV